MSQETNNDLYPEPIIANTKSIKAALRLVILGIVLVGVSILYFIYRDQLGQQFLLGLLGTLAMTGVFYLFGSAINVIPFEAAFFVETDGFGIVGMDRQFQAPDVEPVVRRIDQGKQQRLADAAPGEIVMHAEPEMRGVRPPAIGAMQARVANDLLIDLGNDACRPRAQTFEPFAGLLRTLKGQAQSTGTKTG